MNVEAAEAPECNGHPAGEFDPMGQTVYCDGSCVHAVAANNALDYAAVAEAAIAVLNVVEKTVEAKGSPELKNALSAGLKVQGVSIERIKSLLGLIARKEG